MTKQMSSNCLAKASQRTLLTLDSIIVETWLRTSPLHCKRHGNMVSSAVGPQQTADTSKVTKSKVKLKEKTREVQY